MAPSIFEAGLETGADLEEPMLAIFRSVQYFEIDHPSVRNLFEKS